MIAMSSMLKSLLIVFVIALIGGILTMRPTCNITYPELRICAALGEVECMECLGQRAENSEPADYNQAAKWYFEAAELGSVGAMTQLGNFYRRGHGVGQNAEKGLEWYRKAVSSNPDYNPETLLAIGTMYYQGEGIEQDMQRALAWMKQAAETGHVRAMAHYGIALTELANTPENSIEALAWLNLAAIGVAQPALLSRIKVEQYALEANLTEAQVAEAEDRFLELGKIRMNQAINRF